MSTWNPAANTIFLRVAELDSAEDRAGYLDQACGGDAKLRAQVEELLQAHAAASDFLEQPAVGPEAIHCALPSQFATAQDLSTPVGTQIGPFKLLQKIGEGGMGSVWMAEQQNPVRRLVALKVIKSGMDSAQVVARFEAERQALALMDHPNIARVFDGGATPTGQPFFAMELVKGEPITQYCDTHRLSPRQRLELFLPVCHAIQHAHQKGIIHRDIKPSNILIAPFDGKPVVKVIDFGIAKATGQRLTERTLFTEFGAVVGTLEYMSPEQAELNNQDVDTRSDIYSLGVLLYELLTGTTPLQRGRFQQVAFMEMLRIIREEEPPKPSTRLNELSRSEQRQARLSALNNSKQAGDKVGVVLNEETMSLASLSAQRHTEPSKLTRLVRGELDWIVMKALEKDRARRYETANGLARDVERYLADESVQACPPSAGYRLRKLVRRNKVAITTAALVILVMLIGTVASTWQAIRAMRAEEMARLRLEGETKARLDADVARGKAEVNFQKALEAVDQMLTEVGEESLANVPQMEPVRRALLEKALAFYQQFLEQRSSEPSLRYETGRAYQRVCDIYWLLGKYPLGETACRRSVALFEELEKEFPNDANYRYALAESYRRLGERLRQSTPPSPAAMQIFQNAIARHERLVAQHPNDPRYSHSLGKDYHSFAYYLRMTSQLDEAESAYRRAIDLHTGLVNRDPNSAEYLYSLGQHHRALGVAQWSRGRMKEAEASVRQAITLQERLLANQPELPRNRQLLATSYYNLGMIFRTTGRTDDAINWYLAAKALQEKLTTEFPSTPIYRSSLIDTLQVLGSIRLVKGELDEVKKLFAEAVRLGSSNGSSYSTLAWMAVITPDIPPAAAELALQMAKHGVELEPENGIFWNTLGWRIIEWVTGRHPSMPSTKQCSYHYANTKALTRSS